MPRFILGAVFLFASCFSSFAQTVQVLYETDATGTLATYTVNSNTAVATLRGQEHIPALNVDPFSIGTRHYIYVWDATGVWLYPTNAKGVPTAAASQHLVFNFTHPLNGFLVDPNGKFAYAALAWTDSDVNETSHASITLFTINQSSGRLTNTNQVVASYSHAFIGFLSFVFGVHGGDLFGEFLDNGPHTTIFGYDYYQVNQQNGKLGALQSLQFAQTGECETSCSVAISGGVSAAAGVCCGPGSGSVVIARNAGGQNFACQTSDTSFCGDDVAHLAIDPASTNLFFGDETVNETFIGNIDFSTSQLAQSPSSIPGTPPLYFSADSRLVYALNTTDIGIYAFHPATGLIAVSTALPYSGSVKIATATLHN